MITNDNPSDEQINESKTINEVVSVQNQLAVTPTTNNNDIARVSESSTDDEWSSSDENDGKQVAEIESRVPAINGAGINNAYTNCTGVTSVINNTNVYKSGVTVNHNFYCCPFSLKQALKWPCTIKRKIIIPVAMVLAIPFVVFLAVWLLTNLKLFNDVDSENISATTTVIPSSSTDSTTSTTIISSSSTILTTSSTVIPSSSTDLTSSTTEILSTTTDLSNSSTTENPNYEWRIISRKEWGALTTNSKSKELPFLPPQYVILDETETDTCTTREKCMEIVRTIQADNLETTITPDIFYNFLVGGDGMIYEGRGWDVHAFVADYDTEYLDDTSIRISLIGRFNVVEPSDIIIQATMSLLDFAVTNKKLIREYKLLCLRQLSNTIENPGQHLFDVIKQWKEWDSRTIEDFPPTEYPGNWEYLKKRNKPLD